MTKQELIDENFIIGHKVRIMSEEEMLELEQKTILEIEQKNISEDKKNYLKRNFEDDKKHAKKYAGEIVITDSFEFGNLYFYREPEKNWRTDYVSIKFFKLIGDNRRPSKEAYEVVEKLLNTGLHIFCATYGEVHGSSENSKLTKENTFPALDKNGDSCIHIPNCGNANNLLELNIAKKLLEDKKCDVSFSTGGSFIRRELHLYAEEELKGKTVRY